MKYSAFLIACCLVLGGCAPRRLDRATAIQHADVQTAELIRRYGELHDRGAELYLRSIVDRLLSSYPGRAELSQRYRVIIVRALDPIAVSPGNGTVIVSRGLLLRLSNEAELAFVLAHELGHDIQGHTISTERSPEDRRAYEFAADRFGLGLMALAGYDPRPAVQALAELQRMNDLWTTDPNYPDFVNRLAGIQTALYASHWQPPGTVDRRDFHKLRAVLCNYPPRATGGVCG